MRAVVLCALMMIACGESHGVPGDDLDELVAACVAELEPCGPEIGFCCEGHCFDTGYGEGTCMPRLDDGQFCLADDACRNGRCTDNVCGGPGVHTCANEGGACADMACCGDLVCWESTCIRQRADGEECSAGGQCVGGHCNAEGVCGPETTTECVPDGNACGFGHGGGECCDGRECRWISYGIATCIVPKVDGSVCVYSDECASHVCSDGLCRSETCAADVGSSCVYDHGCCSGFCTSAGDYGAGSCQARVAAGESCLTDNWCQSFSCSAGTCD